MSVPEICP